MSLDATGRSHRSQDRRFEHVQHGGILGVAALVGPISASEQVVRLGALMAVAATILLLALVAKGVLSPLVGLVLLLLCVASTPFHRVFAPRSGGLRDWPNSRSVALAAIPSVAWSYRLWGQPLGARRGADGQVLPCRWSERKGLSAAGLTLAAAGTPRSELAILRNPLAL